jgi:hypothetical protein
VNGQLKQLVPVKQAAVPNVPNPLDGLRRTADAAKSAVSSLAPQKARPFVSALHGLVLLRLIHSALPQTSHVEMLNDLKSPALCASELHVAPMLPQLRLLITVH